jgi:hydroxymethylpyrimidine/phosphomethylpyrimidine kinase
MADAAPVTASLFKMKTKQTPIALTIAGSDSGAGAGIQADLKTFAALGVHGTSAITCITAQNPRQVLGAEACSPRILRQQLEAVFAELPPAAVKTGMLLNRENIGVIVRFLKTAKYRSPLVVDPVMVSTSGTRLLAKDAVAELQASLLPLATLITPNLDEAAILTGHKIGSLEQMRAAARELHDRFGCAVLVKGGHLKGSREAADIFFDGKNELLLSAPFIKGITTHGTGCTYSAAICAALAGGYDLPEAVAIGKDYITAAIRNGYQAGKHFVLGAG